MHQQSIKKLLLLGVVLAVGIGSWILFRQERIPPDDPLYEDQENLADIQIEAAWKKGYTGRNIRIALIDSGVAPHEDLDFNHIKGRNYTGENQEDYTDRLGHGTFIAGMLAAKRNNGSGMAGMTKSNLVVLKVMGEKQPDVSIEMLSQAVLDAYEEYHCDLISISMGTPNHHEILKKAIDKVTNEGVIVVAAAGTSEQVVYPAGYDNVIGVGMDSTGEAGGLANKSIFVTAPGANLIGPQLLGGYERKGTGTSYAVAHITAIAAFAKEHDRKISVEKLKDLLKKSVDDKGKKGYDPVYGWGALNVSRFIAELKKI